MLAQLLEIGEKNAEAELVRSRRRKHDRPRVQYPQSWGGGASGKVILLEWNDASPVLVGRKRCLFDYLFTAPQNPVNLWALFKRSSLLLFGHQSAQEKASVRETLL